VAQVANLRTPVGGTFLSRQPDEQSGKRASVLSLIPRLAKLLYRLGRDRRVPWTVKAVLLALAAYLACPIDLIPDWIPVLGYLDDIVIVGFVVGYLLKRVPREVIREHWGEDLSALESLRRKKLKPE
jgi:uncharacterized membrane protein YkvA (DUF1232 family)